MQMFGDIVQDKKDHIFESEETFVEHSIHDIVG